MSHKASKIKGLAWLTGACLVGFLFTVGIAPLAGSLPWQWELYLSQKLQSADS